jgi:hypothetical protein
MKHAKARSRNYAQAVLSAKEALRDVLSRKSPENTRILRFVRYGNALFIIR